MSGPPLPSKLPPDNRLHRDIWQDWCQQLKISSKGQISDAYRRQYAYAYPNQTGLPTLEDSAAVLKGVNTTEVTTSAPEAVLGSWARDASMSGKMEAAESEAVESPQESYGVRRQRQKGWVVEGNHVLLPRLTRQQVLMLKWNGQVFHHPHPPFYTLPNIWARLKSFLLSDIGSEVHIYPTICHLTFY
ncbi:Developmental pluripotency-associated protein 4 [Tupaia chinensis]|uniref:Developmental pluripotency-associated protein 4 n=1 Tax=Tupaia chinensis TaxID=246437 RepID=L9KJQ6_TUPCH|nr:Developmental pluripotency-associated protein 4 [Tupaia chinensis]